MRCGFEVENGEPSIPISELLYPIDFIPKDFKPSIRISKLAVEEYQKGLSLSQIATKYNRSKNFIRSCLMREGIKLRDKFAEAMALRRSRRGKQGARPYYGFCYMDAEIVKDPKEYPTLVLIHDFWKADMTIHQVVKELNSREILSRTGRKWSWAAVQIIINRFKQKLVWLEY